MLQVMSWSGQSSSWMKSSLRLLYSPQGWYSPHYFHHTAPPEQAAAPQQEGRAANTAYPAHEHTWKSWYRPTCASGSLRWSLRAAEEACSTAKQPKSSADKHRLRGAAAGFKMLVKSQQILVSINRSNWNLAIQISRELASSSAQNRSAKTDSYSACTYPEWFCLGVIKSV